MIHALQICYYPVRQVMAGGQIRVANLANLIKKIGFEHHFLGVFPYRNDGWATDFPLGSVANDWVFRVPYDFEMRISDAIMADRKFHNRVLAAAEILNPTLLWFEHPFLWPIFRDWANRHRSHLKIVYSSHNVEWALKKEMLQRLNLADDYCIQRLYSTERDLLFTADTVLCCSEDDRDTYRRHGRPDAIVVPNGSTDPEISKSNDEDELTRLNGLYPTKKYTLAFISSWHEPNWFGLRDLVLAHMKPGGLLQDTSLLLMGDICSLYDDWCKLTGAKYPNVICLGRVSDAEKSAIFKLSDIVVLPISAGGGTNLKTAEALLSRRVVAATDIAFRGFERHLSQPGVFCGKADEFRGVLSQAIQFVDKIGSRSALENHCSQRLGQVADCCWPHIISTAQQRLMSTNFEKAARWEY